MYAALDFAFAIDHSSYTLAQISSRGSSGCSWPVRARVPLCARRCTFGRLKATSTIWSPRWFLRALKTPFSRSRNFWPFCVPCGIFRQRAPVDGRHFDLGARARLRDRHRHLDLDIVAFAVEERMRLDVGW